VTILDPANDLCRGNTCAIQCAGRVLCFDYNNLSAVDAREYEKELGAE
jgi:hypothetical protein